MAKTLDLTQGPIAKKLLMFALPLLGASLVQQLYTTVDILFVSNFLGAEASAAVGASVFLTGALINFFTGVSIGAGVVIAQAFGRKNDVQLGKSIHTSMALGLIGGVLLTVLGVLFAAAFLRAVDTPASIFQDAYDYVQVFFLGLTFMLVFNMAAGVMRALGNSQTPLLIQLVCGIIHIATNYLFILYMDNGVLAVAWSSVLSQVLSAALSVRYLLQNGVVRLKKLAVDGPLTKEIIRIGLPAGLQGVVVSLSNVFVQYFINGFGVTAIAAFTAYFRIELLFYMPLCALGQAMMTFTGQNVGARLYGRVKSGLKTTLVFGVAYSLALAAVLLYFGRETFGIFYSEPAVIDMGVAIIWVTFPLYFFYVFLETFADTLRGGGESAGPMYIVLFNQCIFRTVILVGFMQIAHDIRLLAAVYPITWGTAGAMLYWYYRKGTWMKA
ncbi:MAG: MATE family efflux transporter [Schwartzia sp.]|nr:MATE family efflux transporter [Schwartzia sp. (in: firmicutes)]MBR1886110.1 MATE family efflux transporter [Schwartzia sp. (in: firmicutes)]